MELIVHKLKPSFGNANGGNTARRFFIKSELSGEITGLDVNLIKNFSILLRTLSSGFGINLIEFKKLCFKTKTLYLNLYPWYYKPVTVHKILENSSEFIITCILPIGQLSEESQEARNKDIYQLRGHRSKKTTYFHKYIFA